MRKSTGLVDFSRWEGGISKFLAVGGGGDSSPIRTRRQNPDV